MHDTTDASGDIAIAKARHAADYRHDTKFHEDLLTHGNHVGLSLLHSMPIQGGVQLIYQKNHWDQWAASLKDGIMAKAGAAFLLSPPEP